jgi:hypothetical protein
VTLPRALLCPRCGNTLDPLSSDLSTRCTRCHTEVKLDDPIARHYAPSPILAPNPRPAPRPVTPAPPAPPSPFWGRLRKALLPLCGAASGALLAQNAHIFRLQRGSAAPALHLAVLTGIVAITLLATRRKILSAALAFAAGLLLATKPILRPLFYEDHAFSLTSETHLYFLLPGGALLVFGGLVLMSLPRKEQGKAEKPEDRGWIADTARGSLRHAAGARARDAAERGADGGRVDRAVQAALRRGADALEGDSFEAAAAGGLEGGKAEALAGAGLG